MPVIAYIEFDKFEGLTKRRHPQIMRESLRFAMVKHVNVRLGDHFKQNAKTAPGGAYGFKARNKKYVEGKIRKFGGDAANPNVRTGKLKRFIRNNALGRITATQYRSRVRMSAYWTASKNNKNAGFTPERRREMEVITPQERIEIANDVHGEYVKQINDPSNRRIRRRKRLTT